MHVLIQFWYYVTSSVYCLIEDVVLNTGKETTKPFTQSKDYNSWIFNPYLSRLAVRNNRSESLVQA